MTSSSFRQYPQPDIRPSNEIQADWDAMRQVEQIDVQNEEDKKKRDAQAKEREAQQKAQQEKNKQQLQEPTGVGGVLKEVGTAVVGAGIDAVEGVAGNVQQAVTGQLNNPNFTPTWLQVDDRVEPINKTWWGNLIRGVGEYGLLSALTRGAANKVGGPAARVLGGRGIGSELARGAVVGNFSSQSQGDNLSRVLTDAFPWFPDVLATNDADSPLMKRFKNTLEGLGLDFVFDRVAGSLKGLRAAKQADEAALLQRQAELKPGDTPELVPESRRLPPARDNTDIAVRVTEAEIKANQKAREANFDELANSRLADDPEGLKGPDPYVNSPIFDASERPIFSVKKDGLEQALLDEIRISTDPRYFEGRPATLFTEAALEKRLAGESPARRRVIESVARDIANRPEFIGEYSGVKVTKREFQQVAIARALDTLDEFNDPEDLEALKAKLLSQPATEVVGGRSVNYMNRENLAAAELLLNVTAGEMADLATASRSVRGALDTTTQEDMILRRMEFLLKETYFAKYMAGSTLNSVKYGGLNLLRKADVDEIAQQIDSQVASTINTLKELRDSGDDTLVKLFTDAVSISDGKIKTLVDLDRYMQDRIWKWNGSPDEQGGIARGFVSTFVNSVLSGPKTVLRAWTGTSLAVALRPITLYTGALIRGDARLQAKALHQMAVWHEGANEALTLFSKAWKSHLAGEGIPYSNFAGNTDSLHNTEQWRVLGEWVKERGTLGDQAGYNLATMMSRFNNFPPFNYSMGLMGAGDAANRTILGRMELKSMAFDRAWDANKGTVDAALVRKYEEEMHGMVFNKDGLVTDKGATMAGDEAALTTDLSGNFKQLETLMNSNPLLKPFFMFPKTGINALKYAFSYNPLGNTLSKVPALNSFLKEVDEVMNVTPDTLEAVMTKYGIKDIEAAKAMYEGRVAFGQLVTFSAAGLYLSGNLTGNGPHDKETRNAWIQAGWKPRSIKLGDVWVGYDSIDPFASLLAMVADIGDNSDQLGQTFTETWYERVSYVIAMNLTNKSFLAGIQPLAEILSAGGVGAQANRTAAMFLNNAIPFSSLRKEVAEAFNPGMRELEDNLWDIIRNRNPGFKGQLAYKRDVLNGQPLRLYEPMVRFANIISPFQINPEWNETRELLRRSGFDIAFTLRTDSKGNKLSAEARSRLQNEMGKMGIESQLAELFKTNDYLKSFQLAQEVRARGIPSRQWPIEAFYHTQAIKQIFMDAKATAEAQLRLADGETQAVNQAQTLSVAKEAAKAGDTGSAREYLNLLEMYK